MVRTVKDECRFESDSPPGLYQCAYQAIEPQVLASGLPRQRAQVKWVDDAGCRISKSSIRGAPDNGTTGGNYSPPCIYDHECLLLRMSGIGSKGDGTAKRLSVVLDERCETFYAHEALTPPAEPYQTVMKEWVGRLRRAAYGRRADERLR
jgi:hypothetical protein